MPGGLAITTAILLLATAAFGVVAAVPSPTTAFVAHAPIVIDGDAGFTPANGVTGGSGTTASPYILSGWSIFVDSAAGIAVRNTSLPFVIRDVEVNGSSTGDVPIGLVLQNVTNASIERAHVSNTRLGFEAIGTRHLAVSNSTFDPRDFWQTAVSAVIYTSGNRAEDVSIVDCDFDGAYTAVETENVSRLTLARNTFIAAAVNAIFLWGSDNVTILENRFILGSASIGMVGSRHVEITGNRFGEAGMGGALSPSTAGVQVGGSEDVIFIGNDFEDIGYMAIAFAGDNRFPELVNHGVLAYHNSIVGTTKIQGAPPDSVWDGGYPTGGNYWSDFTGSDSCRGPAQDDCSNRDGFVDTPRSLLLDVGEVGMRTDGYPLVREYPLPTSAPTGRFVILPSFGDTSTEFTFDGSASTDSRDPVGLLQFRWDWDGDGVWDTAWSNESVTRHVFADSGTYDARVQVRNTAGLSNSTLREVHVSPLPLAQALERAWPLFVAGGVLVVVAAVLIQRYRAVRRQK